MFLENIAEAYAAMFADGPSIDSSLRDQYINTLQNEYIFQRVGRLGVDNYGGEPPNQPTPNQPEPLPLSGSVAAQTSAGVPRHPRRGLTTSDCSS